MADDPDLIARRRRWMRAGPRDCGGVAGGAAEPLPPYRRLRGPEAGLVMVRGRPAAVARPSTWAR